MKRITFATLLAVLLSCNHTTNPTKNCLTKENEKSLVALGQLWGFLKYHHPTVAEGKLDWDAELINLIPAVMEAKNEDDWKTILDGWVDNLPEVSVTQKDTVPWSKVVVKADYGELFNTEYFNQKTIDKLQFILDNTQIKENHYIKLNYQRTSNDPFITITNEPTYEDMAFPELSYRILGLFRYWNIVNYFFPYRELCDTKWSEVLPEMLPEFVCAENQKEYTLACLKLSAKIDDSHGYVGYRDSESYYEIYGRRKVPFETKFIENKLVVASFLSDSVGYILPSSCKPEERENEVTRIISNTKGLIIDLRCYPSDYNAVSIAPYLMKNWGYYCKQSFGNISFPGYFFKGYERPLPTTVETGSYPYKVVVMVNEYTQSQAEDHTFFYYLAPQVTIIGSTTAGANGAVFSFPLPGGLMTYITGIGMYYLDGTCMQRAGIRIDEGIKPTIEGIKKGIDEPLERAIEIIKG